MHSRTVEAPPAVPLCCSPGGYRTRVTDSRGEDAATTGAKLRLSRPTGQGLCGPTESGGGGIRSDAVLRSRAAVRGPIQDRPGIGPVPPIAPVRRRAISTGRLRVDRGGRPPAHPRAPPWPVASSMFEVKEQHHCRLRSCDKHQLNELIRPHQRPRPTHRATTTTTAPSEQVAAQGLATPKASPIEATSTRPATTSRRRGSSLAQDAQVFDSAANSRQQLITRNCRPFRERRCCRRR